MGAKRTNHCFLVSLVNKAGQATCENIDTTMDDIFDDCASHPDICDAVYTEYDALYRLFNSSWVQVAKSARICPRYILDQFVQRSMSKQMNKNEAQTKRHSKEH